MKTPRKPAVMPVCADAIPMTLKKPHRWLVWSWSWNGVKWDKPPRQLTGVHASSTDPATWTSFDRVLEAHQKGLFDGIGFVLGKDEDAKLHYSGVDLDHCITAGEVCPAARYITECIDSYTEISPSGEGLKIFTLGAFPPGRRADESRRVELYDTGRYFTVTGRHFAGSPKEVNFRGQQLADLHRDIFYQHPRGGGKHHIDDREIAKAALFALDKARAVGYHQWLLVGMALASVSDDLLGDWVKWSQVCPEKYVAGECEKKWATFKRSGVGLGSLIYWARQDGWDGPYEENGSRNGAKHNVNETTALGSVCPADPHMGDGLTEQEGAGPWSLIVVMGNPRRYLLRSPIWENSPNLKDGYIVLTKAQLFKWHLIRIEATEQAGVWVPPDGKKTVWDSKKGPRLLRRLLALARTVQGGTDEDCILAAAEYVIDRGRRAAVMTDDKRDATVPRDVMRLEDGSILFKVRSIAATAKKEAPGITLEDLLVAADRFAVEQCPRIGGKRPRYWVFTNDAIDRIETEINARLEAKNGRQL